MARPEKHTVDYFSHDANASQSRTLTIMFNNFGHDGLSAFWQLLESISSTNNHIISLRNTEDLEYLAAKLRFKAGRLKEILDKLAYLEAIDKELYSNGYIWCQNFVDRLKPVYDSRKQPLPDKNIVSLPNNPVSLPNNPVILADYTHTKGTILNKTKETITNNNYLVVFNHWNTKKIIIHKNLNGIESTIKTTLKEHTVEEILQAISNYAEIILDTTGKYYFDFKWTLKDFLKRGLEKFLDADVARKNYLKNGNRKKPSSLKPNYASDSDNELMDEIERR